MAQKLHKIQQASLQKEAIDNMPLGEEISMADLIERGEVIIVPAVGASSISAALGNAVLAKGKNQTFVEMLAQLQQEKEAHQKKEEKVAHAQNQQH